MVPSVKKMSLLETWMKEAEMNSREQRRNWCYAVISQGMPGDSINGREKHDAREKYDPQWHLISDFWPLKHGTANTYCF